MATVSVFVLTLWACFTTGIPSVKMHKINSVSAAAFDLQQPIMQAHFLNLRMPILVAPILDFGEDLHYFYKKNQVVNTFSTPEFLYKIRRTKLEYKLTPRKVTTPLTNIQERLEAYLREPLKQLFPKYLNIFFVSDNRRYLILLQ